MISSYLSISLPFLLVTTPSFHSFCLLPPISLGQIQVQFDGTLGFSGGMADDGETPGEAVTRELVEEVGRGQRSQEQKGEGNRRNYSTEI